MLTEVENTVGTSCVRSMKIAQTLGNIIYMIKHLLTFDSHFLLNVSKFFSSKLWCAVDILCSLRH